MRTAAVFRDSFVVRSNLAMAGRLARSGRRPSKTLLEIEAGA